jgi:outer membrane protein TolC
VLENLTQAERDTLYQVRLFNRFRKTFVVSIISQYYEVLQQLDSVKNAWGNYNTLDSVYERVEKLANAGRVPQFELDRVRQDKMRALDTCIQAEKEYKQALDEFKITLSLRTTAEFQLDEGELEALRAAERIEPDFAEAEVIETALLRRLDLANNADAVIDAQRKVFVAADSLRAELNLAGSADAISARRADRQTLGWSREDYGLGFELDLPLDRVPEQHVYRKALITLNQRQREYDQAADMVRLQVRQAYRDLTEAAERYKVQSDSLILAEKRFKNTFLLLQYGRANSRRVLSAQDDLFDAQNTATQALVDYTIATLSFYRDTEVLHVRPDGMWER